MTIQLIIPSFAKLLTITLSDVKKANQVRVNPTIASIGKKVEQCAIEWNPWRF